MKNTEENMLQQIAETEILLADARGKLKEANRIWVEAESLVIEHKIKLENLREQLLQLRSASPDY